MELHYNFFLENYNSFLIRIFFKKIFIELYIKLNEIYYIKYYYDDI